jgi:hypothetical protein
MVIFVAMLHLSPLLNVFGIVPGGRVFYTVDTITLLPFFLALTYMIRFSASGPFKVTRLDWCVLAFLLLSVLSVVMYFQPGNPSEVAAYFYGIHHFVLPMFGYFAVKVLTSRQQRRLLLLICLLNFFAMVFGIYFFYERPENYTAYLKGIVFETTSYTEDWQIYARMQSYLGSTAVGVVAAITIVMLRLSRAGLPFMAVILPTMVTSALLSHQRGGIAGCVLGLIYVVFLERRYFVIKVVTVIVTVPVLFYALDFFEERYTGTVERVYERSTFEMQESFANRGYASGLRYVAEFPLGVGLGGASSAADSAGLAGWGQVVDANFMRIVADLGIQGIILFLLIIGVAAHAAFKKQETFGWLAVLGIFCGVSLGTNTLDSHYVSHLFWIILGVIDTPDAVPMPAVVPRTALVPQRRQVGG